MNGKAEASGKAEANGRTGASGEADVGGDAGAAGGRTSGSGRFASREMEEDEVREHLRRNWWGDLATVGDGRPYAVPVVYGWDGDHFWIASRDGTKVRNIEENPDVCLIVVEVQDDGGWWGSVMVKGRADVVSGLSPHLAALRALRKQRGIPGKATPKDAMQFARAKVIRIDPTEITGRAKA